MSISRHSKPTFFPPRAASSDGSLRLDQANLRPRVGRLVWKRNDNAVPSENEALRPRGGESSGRGIVVFSTDGSLCKRLWRENLRKIAACKISSSATKYGCFRRQMMSDQESNPRLIGWRIERQTWTPSGASVSGWIFFSNSKTLIRFFDHVLTDTRPICYMRSPLAYNRALNTVLQWRRLKRRLRRITIHQF